MGGDTQAKDETEFVFIYSTFGSVADAERAAEALVREKLAACVNIHPGMRSVYEWKGAVEREDETAAFIKTRRALASEAMERLRALHPYEVPAMLVLPIEGGNEDYLAWARGQTRG
ncbi:divalent-cation tolerance protein CutA [Parvibaculum sp.]|uniref:divalent-cation tolerance protein CutA n=1 Tax=Parvibaculum sp. TaxID=2024848 RepID=UPI00273014C2|nr:divalent-cation tolerance protein CutA [Parvibaculum sp.]MDP1627243.1 divalent-cation tolerance protein CutA [Parvibaculum sp.]MDP2148949.1 divalent-cation tolerance protein CutA [Parvibaculum sp.]MDP3327284.1 divalent-cation tolerance protein CutA [Parvibaculum sp.]